APVDIEVHVTKRVHLDFAGPVGLAEAAHLEHRRLGLARSWIGGHRIEGTTFRSGRAARRNRCSGWPCPMSSATVPGLLFCPVRARDWPCNRLSGHNRAVSPWPRQWTLPSTLPRGSM